MFIVLILFCGSLDVCPTLGCCVSKLCVCVCVCVCVGEVACGVGGF